jgi:hypothetical protein
MPQPIPSTAGALMHVIYEAWAELQTFLGALGEEDAGAQDGNGWTVRDHTTHIAVWENSVSVLFRGGRRHEALGIDEDYYARSTFDEMNAIIKEQHSHLSLEEAVAQLTQVHHGLMNEVRGLSDAQLATTVRDFFPQAPRGDERRMGDFIYWNTADHYREHLAWMKDLVKGAA